MTPLYHPAGRAARRAALSGDAPAMLAQDVPTTERSEDSGKSSKQSLLVILHYLLKNNTTFMAVLLQENLGGSSYLRHMSSHMGLSPKRRWL
jgi:hypothetical protein